jgi:hypothetical protein
VSSLATATSRISLKRFSLSDRTVGLLAFVAYVVMAVHLTWPMPKDPGRLFYGGVGDPFGSLAVLREMVQNGRPPFLPGTLHDFAAPGGLPVPWIRGLASLPTSLLLYVLAVLFGPIAAYNIFAFSAYPLTGMATFLLARRLSGNAWAAAIAGWAFAFFPYAVIKGHGHYELVHGWVLVLVVWRALVLAERPSIRNGVFAGLATVFAMAWTQYFILLAGVAYATLTIATLFIAGRERELRRQLAPQAVAAGLIVVYLVVFYVLSVYADVGQGLRTHSVAELNAFSARPYEYVVPWAGQPLFGTGTGPWLARHIHGSNAAESTLYLGISMIVLALFAIGTALGGRLGSRDRRMVLILAIVALVAAWVSAPPEGVILGHTLPFPSKFISDVTSTWRVYSRMVSVVMLAVALLGAIGLAFAVRGRSTGVRTLILIVAAVAVVRLDLWPQPQGVNPTGTQPIYQQLARMPRGIVAAYPLLESAESYGSMFDQQWYDMPILDGFEEGSAADQRAQQIADPSQPSTASRLAALGVRYALSVASPDGETMKFGSGFALLRRQGALTLYRVQPQSRRTPMAAFTITGFDPAEQGARGPFQWMTGKTGTIELDGACAACVGTVEMVLESLGHSRVVQVTDQWGSVLQRKRVTSAESRIAVPVRFSRQSKLTISTTPGPIAVRMVLPTSRDPRSVSISVRDVRLTAGR